MDFAIYCQNYPFNNFFHTLFQAWVARCSPNQNLGRVKKNLGTVALKG